MIRRFQTYGTFISCLSYQILIYKIPKELKYHGDHMYTTISSMEYFQDQGKNNAYNHCVQRSQSFKACLLETLNKGKSRLKTIFINTLRLALKTKILDCEED